MNEETTLEYCKECIVGTCYTHKWFTDKQPKTEKEVLVVCLEEIKKRLNQIFEKVYVVENVINDWDNDIKVGGTLVFDFDFIDAVHKKEGIYIPLSCHSFSDDIVHYDINIEVMMMRHHPTEIIIKKGIFSEEELYRTTLIDFDDNLHCESMRDIPEIIKLAETNLSLLIDIIELNGI